MNDLERITSVVLNGVPNTGRSFATWFIGGWYVLVNANTVDLHHSSVHSSRDPADLVLSGPRTQETAIAFHERMQASAPTLKTERSSI